jgi:C-terminal processing protease CtpA/Prc
MAACAAPGGRGGVCPADTDERPALPAPRFPDGPTLSGPDLVSDFDGWLSQMKALHPDLSARVDADALDSEAARIRASLGASMSQREAWIAFAQLNPVLLDGHNGVLPRSYRASLSEHLQAGGRVLPIEVRLSDDGALRVFRSDSAMIAAGDVVEAINGRSARDISDAVQRVAPGDTPGFRRAWAGRRFQALYWLMFGDTGAYDIAVRSRRGCARHLRIPGATRLPAALQQAPAADLLFETRVLAGDIGYLRFDSFEGVHEDAVAALSQRAFAAFKAQGVRALIVDVRENGGGDDPLWQNHIMEHITATPYAQLSRYALRVTQDNADPGDIVGSVQRAEYTRRITPSADDPLRFSGPVYILVGPYSYSAAIQFAVAAQDFGIARIAGEESAALSCQTGQVRPIAMPRSGLSAFAPIIAYTRPSGAGCARGVIPDVAIPIDEVAPERTLQALVARIERDLN